MAGSTVGWLTPRRVVVYSLLVVTYLCTTGLLWLHLPWTPRLSVVNSSSVSPIGFLGDGQTFATFEGPKDRGVTRRLQVWNVATGRLETSYPIKGNRLVTKGMADGTFLIAEADDEGANVARTLRLVESANGTEYLTVQLKDEPGSWTMNPTLSPDATTFAYVEGGSCVRLWDVKTRQLRLTLPNARSPIAFSADGRYVATEASPTTSDPITGVPQGACKLWNAQTGELLRALPIQNGTAQRFAFTMDDQSVLAECLFHKRVGTPADFIVRRWILATGEETDSLSCSHWPVILDGEQGFGFYHYVPNSGRTGGMTLVTRGGMEKRELILPDDAYLPDAHLDPLLPVPGRKMVALAWARGVEPHPTLAQLAGWLRLSLRGRPTGGITFYDVDSGRAIAKAPITSTSAFVSPDGQTLATFNLDGEITTLAFWDVPPRRPFLAIFGYGLLPVVVAWGAWRLGAGLRRRRANA